MPLFRALSAVRGGGRWSAASASATSAASGGDADMWRSSRHCTPSEVASVVSKTSSRQSGGSGAAAGGGSALMVTMSRPPRPTAAASASARSDDKSKDTSKKKKKKERITRTTKPGSSTKSKKKNKAASNDKSKSSQLPSLSATTSTATDRSRSRIRRDRSEQGKPSKARSTTTRSSTPVRRNERDDDDVQNVEQEVLSTPRTINNTSNLSSSPESATSTVVSDSSEGSRGDTTVSTITQTMALDPARVAMDYPELAASLKLHPPLIERTLKCPAGALGCQIDDSSTGPMIDDVLASSSMGGLLFPGDRILSVDGLDVRGLKCGRVKEIMTERKDHEREIKVLSIINIAENGCKGDATEPREGEASNQNRAPTKQKKKRAPAVSSVPTEPTPKAAPAQVNLAPPLHRRSIVAPAGKLGLVLRNTRDGPAIHTIKPASPLQGQIFVGDRVVRVGSTDTTTLRAKELTKLMAGNSTKTREIFVLSAVDATTEQAKATEVMPVSAPSPPSHPTPASSGGDTKKPLPATESITSATASLSTRSDTKNSGTTGSEGVEQSNTSIDHSLPPFRSTPSRRKEGESFQQYLARRRRDLSNIREKKECHDEPACTDAKSRSSDGSRSSVPSFSAMKASAENCVQQNNPDAAIQQYERLISCLEMKFDDSRVEGGGENTKVQQATTQEEIIALCDVLRDLYKANGEKAKSVKCLRRKINTQRSLLKLKMEMMSSQQGHTRMVPIRFQ